MSNESIDFKKILNDSRETLLNPKGYFSSMPLAGGLVGPLIKAAIYGVVAGLFALLWSVLGFSALGASFFRWRSWDHVTDLLCHNCDSWSVHRWNNYACDLSDLRWQYRF